MGAKNTGQRADSGQKITTVVSCTDRSQVGA
jgi:hypothetical protein